MYAPKISGVSTVVGGAGAAVLPNTGNTSVLFYTAAAMFVGGLVVLGVTSVAKRSR